MFLRYESFREYIRFYPVNTILLVILVGVHIGFGIASMLSGYPTELLKQVYGGFVKSPQFVPEYWRYLSSVFLHANFGHLLFNGFALFVFAPPLERALGPFRYAFLFLFAGFLGNVFTMMLAGPIFFSLGASGAVYGVFGGFVYYMLFHRKALDMQTKRTLQIILVIGVIHSLISTNINFYAHLGGFIGGLVLNGLYTKFLQGRYR